MDDGWKKRLADGIERNGLSQRKVSMDAGQGPGYVHSIIKEGKDPTISNLAAICDAAGLSLYFVLGGFDITPEREELLRLLDQADQHDVRSFVRLISAARNSVENPRPSSG